MIYRTLGKTGLRVSLLGLGTGTRFGDPSKQTAEQAKRLVRAALDLGVNYIDVAAMYGEAENYVGQALAGVPREDFVIATKFFPADEAGQPISPGQLRASVERSLARLQLETIDVLQVHGLRPHWYGPVMAALGAKLDQLRREGKYRFLGVAETIVEDAHHAMVPLAANDARFSTALIAYSLLSPWAEQTALPACTTQAMGTIAMVAVRRALHDSAMLARLVAEAKARGEAGVMHLSEAGALDWLISEHSPTLAAAGYRFAASHPAISCVLSGTLNLTHLRDNIAAVCAPPLPADQLRRIREIFLRTNPERWVTFNL